MECKALTAKEVSRTHVDDTACVTRRAATHLAVIVAAACVMLAATSYALAEGEPMFALSSVTWQKQPGVTAKGTLSPQGKPRVAFIIIFRGIRTPITQERIDAMYEELTPTPDIRDRVEILAPHDIKTAIVGKGLRPEQRAALLQVISSDLGAAGVLFVDISGRESGFEIVGEFVDAGTGAVVHKERVEVPGEAQLVAGMHAWLSLIP